MREQPSPWSIVFTDNACLAIGTGAAMVFFIGLMVKLTGTIPGRRGGPDTPVTPEVASIVLACAVALSLLLAAIVAVRVARIRSLFDGGLEVEASVRKVKRLRSGTTLKLEFELYGIPHEASFSFLPSRRTPAFGEGARIPVLVDPANPKRAIPLTLYGDPGTAR
jgi:hypothetical protein